jgi:hypothetical protein
MKKSIFSLLLFLLLFCACEKVIDVDLNSADPKIVIEAAIADAGGGYTVQLTRTVNFDEPNVFPPVSDAFVEISDDAGHTEILNETLPGIYSITALQGVPGRTYRLEVTVDGKTYSANSKMPFPVKIDSITIEKRTSDPFNASEAHVRFQDPAGIENYYRLTQFAKNRVRNIIIDDDRLQDGEAITISSPVVSNNDNFRLNPGDSVTVVLQSINKIAYEYLSTIHELSQEGFRGAPASPANPLSNFTNGALGYFSAYSLTAKTIVIP